MKCKEFQEKWEPYRDGKLTKAETQTMDQHLQNCAKCRREAKALAETYKNLQKIRDKNAPLGLWSEIEDTLLHKERRSGQEKVWGFPQPGLALSLAVIVLVISLAGIQVNRYQARREVNQHLSEIFSYTRADTSWVEYSSIFTGTF